MVYHAIGRCRILRTELIKIASHTITIGRWISFERIVCEWFSFLIVHIHTPSTERRKIKKKYNNSKNQHKFQRIYWSERFKTGLLSICVPDRRRIHCELWNNTTVNILWLGIFWFSRCERRGCLRCLTAVAAAAFGIIINAVVVVVCVAIAAAAAATDAVDSGASIWCADTVSVTIIALLLLQLRRLDRRWSNGIWLDCAQWRTVCRFLFIICRVRLRRCVRHWCRCCCWCWCWMDDRCGRIYVWRTTCVHILPMLQCCWYGC